jgi:hypothetical protein
MSLPVLTGAAVQFPSIALVAELLGLRLLTDLSCPDDDKASAKVVYALARRADLAAGLLAAVATPYFKELALLENFCREHRRKFEAMADAEALPRKFFWEPKEVTPPWWMQLGDEDRGEIRSRE